VKVTKIGGITLDYGLWWKEIDIASDVTATTEKTLDGSLIVFEQANRISAQNLTLESRDDGWQKKATAQALINLANGSMGVDINVELSDLSTMQTRFRYEVDGGSVQFEPIYDGATWYKGTIYMAGV